jgi:hypothetical protein
MQYSHDPGPNAFDLHWQPRVNFAAEFLRTIQNRWLVTDADFPIQQTISVILNIFSFDFHATGFITYRGITPAELARRSVDDWFAIVKSPSDECAKMLPRCSRADHARIVESFVSILADAVSSWENDTDAPTTDEVANDLVEFLGSNRFVRLHR